MQFRPVDSYRDGERKRKAVGLMAQTLGFSGKHPKLLSQMTAEVLDESLV